MTAPQAYPVRGIAVFAKAIQDTKVSFMPPPPLPSMALGGRCSPALWVSLQMKHFKKRKCSDELFSAPGNEEESRADSIKTASSLCLLVLDLNTWLIIVPSNPEIAL